MWHQVQVVHPRNTSSPETNPRSVFYLILSHWYSCHQDFREQVERITNSNDVEYELRCARLSAERTSSMDNFLKYDQKTKDVQYCKSCDHSANSTDVPSQSRVIAQRVSRWPLEFGQTSSRNSFSLTDRAHHHVRDLHVSLVHHVEGEFVHDVQYAVAALLNNDLRSSLSIRINRVAIWRACSSSTSRPRFPCIKTVPFLQIPS